MKAVFFPNWSNALSSCGLPGPVTTSHLIAIRWYLSYLARTQQLATVETARAFIDFAIEEKSPEDWMVDRWRAGIRWFFVNAPIKKDLGPNGLGMRESRAGVPSQGAAGSEAARGSQPSNPTVSVEQTEEGEETDSADKSCEVVRRGEREDEAWEAEPGAEGEAWGERADQWVEASRRLARVRHLELSTEEAYLYWIEDFLRFHRQADFAALADEDVASYLTYLAVERNIASETQRQALNGCVFLLREVMGKELGDFSDYKRARKNRYLPVVLSRQETNRLLAAFPENYRLMAQLQYGAGMRVSEVCRLRVHPMRYYRHGKTLRLCIKVAGRHAILCRLDQRLASQAQAA